MIPDRLQYFLEHVWIDRKCDRIWTLGARIYYQNTSTIQENDGNILGTDYVCKYGNHHFYFF